MATLADLIWQAAFWFQSFLYDPVSLVKVIGLTFGYSAGDVGASFDFNVMMTAWFQGHSQMGRWFIKRLLDVTHHWQYGLVILWLSTLLARSDPLLPFVWSFGLGMLLSDVKDFNRIKRRILSSMMEFAREPYMKDGGESK